jgi:nucleotide-binding universal stress UspA family protein
MKTIVVGVDGSDGAAAALEFAVGEARMRGCALKAVSAWHVPVGAYNSGLMHMIDPTEYERLGRGALDEALHGADANGMEISGVVREGQPAEVLVAESKDAELLVVGSRGLGGFRGLLLGSVGQQCAHHAACPVVIVPHPEPAAAA